MIWYISIGQERCNCIANALELNLSCTNPWIFAPTESTLLDQGNLVSLSFSVYNKSFNKPLSFLNKDKNQPIVVHSLLHAKKHNQALLEILYSKSPFQRLTLIITWISNHIHYKVWKEITYPFPNFYSYANKVWEWIFYWTCDYLSMSWLKLI